MNMLTVHDKLRELLLQHQRETGLAITQIEIEWNMAQTMDGLTRITGINRVSCYGDFLKNHDHASEI